MKLLSIYAARESIFDEYLTPKMREFIIRLEQLKGDDKRRCKEAFDEFCTNMNEISWYFAHINRRCHTIPSVLGALPSCMHKYVTPNYINYVPDNSYKIDKYYELLEVLPLQKYLES